jgi:hypothetical protein
MEHKDKKSAQRCGKHIVTRIAEGKQDAAIPAARVVRSARATATCDSAALLSVKLQHRRRDRMYYHIR